MRSSPSFERTGHRKLALVLTAVVSLVVSGFAGVAAATAAAGPVVKLSQPSFTAYQANVDPDTGFNYWDANFTFHWNVTASAGVCSQTVTYANYDTLGGPIDPILGQDSSTVAVPNAARSYAAHSNAWDYGRGGYSVVVRVRDCHGVKAASNAVHTVIRPGDDTDSAMTYSKGWSVSHCTCFSGGTTHWTVTKNAAVTFRTAKPADPSGVQLVLIMAKAPNRGSAAVYVDGVKKATINTYATTKINRVIVYRLQIPGTATHLVKIVNLATPGHPRIDLDATINGG